MVEKKRRKKWSTKQEEILKRMWPTSCKKEKIAQKVGHNVPATYARARKLGLPMREVKRSRVQLKPIEMLPTKGTVKCHNCLEDIVLSKKGLDRDYKGGEIGSELIFWHLPGRCTGDSNAHFNQFEAKRRKRMGRPSKYDRWED